MLFSKYSKKTKLDIANSPLFNQCTIDSLLLYLSPEIIDFNFCTHILTSSPPSNSFKI